MDKLYQGYNLLKSECINEEQRIILYTIYRGILNKLKEKREALKSD